MHNDENGVVFGDVRSHVHAGPAPPDATLGAAGAVREGRLKSRDELAREVEVLGKRIATLSAAVLRLGSSLDLATVLQEATDSARTLTNGRYSLIVTVDEVGEVREKTLQGRAMRHGVQVGNIFLPDKEDAPEFSAADEEMLELFASHAAAAIVNARAHRQVRSNHLTPESVLLWVVPCMDTGNRRRFSTLRRITMVEFPE